MIEGRKGRLVSHHKARMRTLVVHPWRRSAKRERRSPELKLEEARGLALAIGLKVVDGLVFEVSRPAPATFIGKGKVAEIAAAVERGKIGLVVVDAPLSPVQQRNLERAWGAKVIDRTGLILEIFGARARTREGALQVELAHLLYQKSRLVRTWTHLERQRGGFGFLGGPGERQIEADRRQIQERITRIRKELATVSKRRAVQRKARKRVPYPVVALAGYTNAGKSTLFNTLTGEAIEAAPKLFATLDPTLRAIELESGRRIILSDTVGFISDLPTELVAAFRATLEEVRQANLILHVRDIANPETEAQREDVLGVLASLGVEADRTPIVECLNKIDLLLPARREALLDETGARREAVAVSALTGEGIEALLSRIEAAFAAWEIPLRVIVPADDGEAQAWLHSHARVDGVEAGRNSVVFEVLIADKQLGQLRKRFPRCRLEAQQIETAAYA